MHTAPTPYVWGLNTLRDMKQHPKTYKVSRERAIRLVADHNSVPTAIAAAYTDSELKEVLCHLSTRMVRLIADF